MIGLAGVEVPVPSKAIRPTLMPNRLIDWVQEGLVFGLVRPKPEADLPG